MIAQTFQSTHPLRGATCADDPLFTRHGNFNPRTPCGVRPEQLNQRFADFVISIHAPLAGCDEKCRIEHTFTIISIHAPLAGCDLYAIVEALQGMDFNPRTPCGVRHARRRVPRAHRGISIHAPLAGCDGIKLSERFGLYHFNPRTPCGVRPSTSASKV